MQSGREKLISENLGLVHACANRFRGRGAEYDDLFQAGCLGLIKAADGFDPSLGFCFSTYAVPAVLGEIKRIFRDGGTVKVSRALKEKSREVQKQRELMALESGTEPTVEELAKKCGLSNAETAELLLCSLPPVSLNSPDESERLSLDIPVEGHEEGTVERIDLANCLSGLGECDRRLIELRYYGCRTQSETAKLMGMTQVQVSRRERVILKMLREKMTV